MIGTIKLPKRQLNELSDTSYDAKTNMVKSFIASSGIDEPLIHYSTLLSKAPSLQEILKTGCPRVVNDLSIFDEGKRQHTIKIKAQGYGSSYTMPMYLNGVFWGFIFFNSYNKNCFSVEVLKQINVLGHLISSIVTNELVAIKTVLAASSCFKDS